MKLDRLPLDELAESWGATHHCPSIAWGIVQQGRLVAAGGSGKLDDGSTPSESTVYRIASMTKSFSAAATLLLRDEGAIRLDDPIGFHAAELAGLRSPTDDAADITIRDLLCMTSGLATDDYWADRHLNLTDDEFDAIAASGFVFAEPTGNVFEYSNLGFAVLGRVIHRATGRTIQQHVTERLLGPLGMDATTWVLPAHDDWARPKCWRDDRWDDEAVPLGDGLIAPMGGLWTTVADLATWVAWLADAFPARDGTDHGPLRRASRREMQTSQRSTGMRTLRDVRASTSYGYGVRILDEPNGPVITHSGGLPGYGSNMRWTPGGDVGVIALANVTYAPMAELAARFHDAVHEQGLVPATPRRLHPRVEAAARELVDVLSVWGSSMAVDQERLAAVFADNVGLDEDYGRRANAAIAHGPLRFVSVAPDNDASATITCTNGDGAAVTIEFAIAPMQPERIQDYEVVSTTDADE